MAFWIVAALLTFVACLAVLMPLLRRQEPAAADADFDLEVYQDQLAELERDAARGAIDGAAAQEARAEIGRRILKLADSGGQGVRGTRTGRVVLTIAVLTVPLASWGIYAATGSPHLPSQPLQARLDKDPADSSVEELVAKAEGHLAANPQDGRGWDVLAPIYHRMGRYEEAASAYRHAIRLLGSTAQREVAFAEARMSAAGGVIVAEAREALERALSLEPQNPRARYLLAAAMAQEGRTEEAAQAWRALLSSLPADSPWRSVVTQALAGVDAAKQERGPDAADIEAVEQMSEEDRAGMIEGMVAGLDQRLRENPKDLEGWQRLVQSYLVLERPEAAADALERALDALGRDSEAGRQLAAFAAARGAGVKE